MVGTLCTSGAALAKAGAGVSTDFVEADYDMFINQAENYLIVLSRYDWITNFNSLTTNTKLMLEEAVSNLAGIYLIQYNMAGYTTRIEAEDMINILWARFNQIIKLLADQTYLDFIKT